MFVNEKILEEYCIEIYDKKVDKKRRNYYRDLIFEDKRQRSTTKKT